MSIFIKIASNILTVAVMTIANAGPVLSPLNTETTYEWKMLAPGIALVQRVAQDGKTYQIAYPTAPCWRQNENTKDGYIEIYVKNRTGSRGACYKIFKEPIGYLKDGQLKPMVKKTWPPN